MKPLKELKQQAYDLKKATGVKHAAALDAIAVREGYKNWMTLLRAHPEGQQ